MDANELNNLSLEDLEKLHDRIHIKFNKFLAGEIKDCTLKKIYYTHTVIANQLTSSGGKHFAPIDQLDNIQILEEGEALVDYSFLESDRKLAKINYSGNIEGDEIYLKDILSEFKPFKLKEPFVYIVGGLCNHGKTKGDIDILIKKNKPEDEIEDIPLKFRIMRQLPQKYWDRLHFLYDDSMHGPFTNYVPLYSLVCEVNSKQVFEMSEDVSELISMNRKEQASKSKSQNKIMPFRFYLQPKPVHGRDRDEIYSLESVEDTMLTLKDWKDQVDKGIFIEKKFDGVRVQIHKVGSRVVILTEEGTDVTKNTPSLVDDLKKISHDFVLDAEVELWINGKHENRADAAGVLNTKIAVENEKNLLANVYDVVWFDGEDIHEMDFSERIKFLDKIKNTKHIKKSESVLAKGKSDIKRISKRFISLSGSEGVMYKLPGFVYELDGKSFKFMKFKKERSVVAKVLAVNRVKGKTDVFYYHMGIEGNTFIGKTFNTKIKASVGNKLEVVFVDLNQYTDPKTGKTFFTWWSPRIIAKSNKPVMSVTLAKKLVLQTSGQIGNKKLTKLPSSDLEELEEILIEDIKDFNPKKSSDKVLFDDHKIIHTWLSSLRMGKKLKFSDGSEMTINNAKFLHDKIVEEMLPRGMQHNSPIACSEELSYKKRFVFQNHFRGKSVHGDLRFERDTSLEGYTLMHQVAGEIKEPVLTLEQAEKEGGVSANFKIDLKTGELKQDKIQVATKTTQPLAWLTMEGKTEKAEPGDPAEPGATKMFPGIFDIVDKGTYEEGARKPDFSEYFMDGNVFKGRYISKLLPAERITKGKAKVPFIWFFWKPKTQSPFILSSRSIKESFTPPKGKSFLPAEWEKKIPKNLRWWNKGLTGDKALEMIKEIRKMFLKIDVLEELEQKTKFVLQHHHWKGQFVVRGLPVEHWAIRIEDKNKFFQMVDNPIVKKEAISSVRKKVDSKKHFDFEGEIPPNPEAPAWLKPLNPNKRIPSMIDILDDGEVEIIEETDMSLSLKLNGKKLKGIFNFKRTTPQTEVWTFSKSKTPVAKLSKDFAGPLSNDEIKQIHFLSENSIGASEIARLLSRPVQTIYNWREKLSS